MRKEMFSITGMTCSACSSRVNKTVTALEGVGEVNVNLLKNSMVVTFDGSVLSAGDIVAAVENAGYGAALAGAPAGPKNGKAGPDGGTLELQEMKTRLAVSFLFTIPLFYIAMGPMLGLPLPGFMRGAENAAAYAFSQFLLTIPVLFINFKYYRVGFRTLFSGSPNMDSLIAIGSGAAVVFGIYGIYKITFALGAGDVASVQRFAGNLYFESAAVILTLITLGKFFEARARGRTTDAIAKLMSLAPKTATVVRGDAEIIIGLDEVLAGDVLVVKAGEIVPVDGLITEGSGLLDESALTGESMPLEKKAGDSVTGATINKYGHFYMRAVRVGEDTTLARIVKLVDEATSSKAPVARLADKISGVFVPVVMVIAVVAVAAWLLIGQDIEFALSAGIAVLVISCPCALGLATPTAIMVGTGRGALEGIFLKSAEAIETAGLIDTVVLDKTGTITEGRPVLTDILAINANGESVLLALAASLEKMSEHPLGAAIVAEAQNRGLELYKVSDFAQSPGQGISGNIDGIQYIAGNANMLRQRGIHNSLADEAERMAAEGKTVLYFGRGTELVGLIAVTDAIKKNSRQAVAELENMGLEVIMLTGDNAKTAEAVRRQAGIGKALAGLLPQDKEKEIRALQERGKKVAMIGDGINDAPALVRADVGIAIGAGTDIAIEAADIVLMKNDLLDAVSAIQLSRAVMRNIRQNLFWAFFYNTVGIPVAAGVFYSAWGLALSPMFAAAAMSFSSVSVVGNALRLRLFRPKRATLEDVQTSMRMSVKPEITRSPNMKKTIGIEGMSCGHCTGSVEKALRAVAGVTQVAVDLTSKSATVEVDNGVSEAALKKAVTDIGFTVTGIAE